ncbi:putative PEP-binding protein [Candidatus Solirubrobacter pratensis]|uniref:putative PEP-binding protein n=1 Tax=Candidatus Solirubrobacter pratensis TaxID=1298857 RepID=UPI000419FF2B|nr:putative PEP-binding protein [Candidatus Solirubrobacter pratensis]
MAERILPGLPAAPGVATGRARVLAAAIDSGPVADRDEELARARAALAEAGAQLEALAARLRAEGRGEEAEIVETGVLMAADPALDAALEAAILTDGLAAAAALVRACAIHADAIAALGDETLALRADDVRSLGRRAAALAATGASASGGSAPPAAGAPTVLIAEDLGPADVAELSPDVVAIALAAGGPSAHAAVIARGLGIPMVVGAGAGVLSLDGDVLVDGDRGEVVAEPARQVAERRAVVARGPGRTRDGEPVRILANAAGSADVRVALTAGAEGVGLLRTELAFLDAPAWPDEAAHRAALEPVLHALAGRTATVRVLDFGGDKTPPFLRGTDARGIALLRSAPAALAAQLRAIEAAGAGTDLRVLLPLVHGAEDVDAVRALAPRVTIGAMLETADAIGAADEIAAAADFLSIGTNDLTADVLGADRFAPGATATHDPRMVRAIVRAGEAAAAHGRVLEVCGEAASDPRMIPLLIGAGVTELSVGAARVGETWERVAAVDSRDAARLVRAAANAPDAAAVERLLGQAGHAGGERLDGPGRIVPAGRQP